MPMTVSTLCVRPFSEQQLNRPLKCSGWSGLSCGQSPPKAPV